MLLVGNGTGLAPLIGIARDALFAKHTGEIWLYHGSRKNEGLYLSDELLDFETANANFHYVPCVSRDAANKGAMDGRADDCAFEKQSSLKNWRIFLCGYPPMIASAKARAMEFGALEQDIYTDPYQLKNLHKTSRDNI